MIKHNESSLSSHSLGFGYTSDLTLTRIEAEPAEKAHRFGFSTEMSEVEEAPVWLLPPVPLAHAASVPSPGSGCGTGPTLDRSGEGMGNGLEAPRYVSCTARHGSLLDSLVASHFDDSPLLGHKSL